MRIIKILVVMVFSLTIGFWGCTQGQKVEAPKQEIISKNLVPAKVEMKGKDFLLNMEDLRTTITMDKASKEIVETPKLEGQIKITNNSKEVLDIQAITLEYLDSSGKVIPFSSGDKIVKVNSFWKTLQPGEATDGSLDATIPKKALKDKLLEKVEVNLVYVPSPLKRETMTLAEKVE